MCLASLFSKPKIPDPIPPPPPPEQTDPMEFAEDPETSQKRKQAGTRPLQIPLGGTGSEKRKSAGTGRSGLRIT